MSSAAGFVTGAAGAAIVVFSLAAMISLEVSRHSAVGRVRRRIPGLAVTAVMIALSVLIGAVVVARFVLLA